MSWNSKKSNKVTNIILGLICIALVIILGGLLVTNRKEVNQESERLQKLSEQQETGIDDYESVKKHVSELEQEAAEEESAEASKTSKDTQKSSDKEQSAESDTKESSKEKTSSDSKASSESENTDKNNTESKDSEKK